MENFKNYERPKDFIDPGLPSKCTWSATGKEKSPHIHRPTHIAERPKIHPNILECIGCTPLVKLNRIPQSMGIECDVYVKCEYLNPGGSVKDRIGYRMVLDAEAKGILKPGCTLIEPTSGNTGLGIAMAAAVKGYKCIIVMPDKMSNEKVNALRTLGAKIVRTPIEAPFDHPAGLMCVAQRLAKEIPNAIILDQYRNPGNPLAHYDGTGAEILWQLDNKVDAIVCGAGTVGTITGIGRRVKESVPTCHVIGVDPYGSLLARPESLNKTDVTYYEVEGIGYDFIPTITDLSVIDEWVKIYDKDCFPMSKRLNAEEGILCGGSSGGAVYAALQYAKKLKAGQRVVAILPDSIRNYMTKFVLDNWMEARDLKELVNEFDHWWWTTPISALQLTPPPVLNCNATIGKAIEELKKNKLTEMPMVDEQTGIIIGVVGQETLLNNIVGMGRNPTEPAVKALNKRVIRLPSNAILGKLARVLDIDPYVLIIDKDANNKDIIRGIATKMDTLSFIAKGPPSKIRNINTEMDSLKLTAKNSSTSTNGTSNGTSNDQ